MTRPLLIALMAVTVLACSPQKKLQRLLKKHPELAVNDTIRDTVTVTRTDTIPGDTAWKLLPVHVFDTVRIDTGRLHVRVVRLPGDTLFIAGACDTVFKTDTLRVPFQVVTEKLVPCPPNWIPWWVYALCGACLLIALFSLIKR